MGIPFTLPSLLSNIAPQEESLLGISSGQSQPMLFPPLPEILPYNKNHYISIIISSKINKHLGLF